MHLRQTEFTYNACGPFTKNKEILQEIKEIGNIIYSNQNKLDKAYFSMI